MFLLLHGTGGDESDLLAHGRELNPEAALLGVRGRILENGMPRFFRRTSEGVFDEEEVIARALELGNFVRLAATDYGFAMKRLVAVGYSNGANIAAAMLLLGTAPFQSAILFRAMVPLTRAKPIRLDGTGVLILSGSVDPLISPQKSEALARLLRVGGAEVKWQVQPAGHQLIPADIAAAKSWLSLNTESRWRD